MYLINCCCKKILFRDKMEKISKLRKGIEKYEGSCENGRIWLRNIYNDD